MTGACVHFNESLSRTKRSKEKLSKTFRLFKPLFSNRKFIFYTLQMAFAQGILFGYIAASPFIIQQHYGYSPLAFSLFFAVNAVAIGVGAAMAVKFKRQENAVRVSCGGMLLFAILVAAALTAGAGIWVFETLMICLLFVMGLTFTAATTLAMDCAHEQAGSASALLGALGFLSGSIVSPLVGLGNLLVSTGMTFVVCAVCSAVCAFMAQRREANSCARQNA